MVPMTRLKRDGGVRPSMRPGGREVVEPLRGHFKRALGSHLLSLEVAKLQRCGLLSRKRFFCREKPRGSSALRLRRSGPAAPATPGYVLPGKSRPGRYRGRRAERTTPSRRPEN